MKKVYILSVSLLFLFSAEIYAQAPAIDWQKCLGGNGPEEASSIKQTTDGGYIVAGYVYANSEGTGDVSGHNGYVDIWVVKLNSTGDTVWTKCLGNGGLQEATSIQQTADGGYIVAGNTTSGDLGYITGTHGDRDYWIIKLSSTGTIQWQKCYGGTYGDYPKSIVQTSDGGYIVAGETGSNNGDVSCNGGGWLVKLSSTGTIQWDKCYGGSLFSIKQTADGGYIVAGGTADGNYFDYWVAKLGNLGTVQWQKSFGGSGDDYATSIDQTTDGGYIVAGRTTSNDGDVSGNHGREDYWVVKLNSTGTTIEWQKSLGGTAEDRATSVNQTTDGGYIVAGYASSNDGDVTGNHGDADYWIVKLSNTGTLLWQKTYGSTGRDEALSLEQTTDGGYIAAGRAYANDGDVSGIHGGDDFWVVKLAGSAQLAIATTTVVKNITGNAPVDVNDGNYKLVTLTPTGGANALSGDVTTMVTVNPTISTFNNLPFVRRHYDITPAVNAANAQATVTLYFTQLDFNIFNDYVQRNSVNIPLLPATPTDNNIANVRITQFHGTFTGTSDPANYNNGSTLISQPPLVVTWDASNGWWVLTFPVTGFSGFYLSTIDLTVLPLTLLDFKGVVKESAVTLQWLTSDEVNTNEFVIERSNQNTGFISIGKVPARSTAGTHQYGFTDTKPLAGNNFYRLKMTDKDGNFTYSKIVPIKINDAVFKLSVYPIPAKNILNVKTSSTGNNKITLQVTDLAGKLLLNKVTITGNGENIISLNVSQLSSGTYFLKMFTTDGKENAVKKFVKQ